MLWVGAGELPSAFAGKTDGVNRLGSYLGRTGATSQYFRKARLTAACNASPARTTTSSTSRG